MSSFRIPDSTGATVFALLAGFAALFFGAWLLKSSDSSNPAIASLSGADSPARIQELEGELEAESSRRADLASQLRDRENEAERLKSELENSGEQVRSLQSDKKRLSEQLKDAKEKIERQRKNADEELEQAKSESDLKAASLEENLAQARRERDEALHGDALEPAGEFDQLDLPYLVNDPIQLSAPVRPLFIRLREYDGGAEDREKLYKKLTENGKRSALHQVSFEGGSSDISEEELDSLAEKVSDVPGDARFLVVGYASTDGEASANYELSSRRASEVAEAIAEEFDGPDAAVEAVYFGQTARFNAEKMAPNRVVEIWRVDS